MTRYLLDTNVCIEWMRAKNTVLLARLRSVPLADLRICSVVVGELAYGLLRGTQTPANKTMFENLVKSLVSLPFDDAAAMHYATIRADLSRLGMTIGPNDTQIAAIALQHGLTLVTHNTREFSRVAGLTIEDWHV